MALDREKAAPPERTALFCVSFQVVDSQALPEMGDQPELHPPHVIGMTRRALQTAEKLPDGLPKQCSVHAFASFQWQKSMTRGRKSGASS